MTTMKRTALLAGVLVASTGCPGHGGGHYAAPAVTVTVADVIAKLDAQRTSRASFTGESTMDYWLGDQRVKGTVLVMGTSQRQNVCYCKRLNRCRMTRHGLIYMSA